MDFNIIDTYMLPALFLVGIATSVEDIKLGKVRNKWILIGLIYGLTVVIGLALWSLIANPASDFYYAYIANIGPDEQR